MNIGLNLNFKIGKKVIESLKAEKILLENSPESKEINFHCEELGQFGGNYIEAVFDDKVYSIDENCNILDYNKFIDWIYDIIQRIEENIEDFFGVDLEMLEETESTEFAENFIVEIEFGNIIVISADVWYEFL